MKDDRGRPGGKEKKSEHIAFFEYEGADLSASHCATTMQTPFAFDLHIHNDFECIYVFSGKGVYCIEDRKYMLKENLLILTPPLQYHYVKLEPGCAYDRTLISCPISFFGKEVYERAACGADVIDCTDLPIVRDLFSKIDYYGKNAKEEQFRLTVSHLLQEMFLNLELQKKSNFKGVSSIGRFSPLVSEAIARINADFCGIRNIRQISEKLYITEAYFFRIFKAETGMSPKKYMTVKRLMYARSLLLSGEKPTAVCYQCGFESYPAFYKRYTAYFGHAPSREQTDGK